MTNHTRATPQVLSTPARIAMVLALLVVALLLFYVWGAWGTYAPVEAPPPLPPDTRIEALRQDESSDDLDAIERDLGATVLSDLDADVADVERELLSPTGMKP